MIVGIVSLTGRLVAQQAVKLETNELGELGYRANASVKSLLEAQQIDHPSLIGVGFALPGDFIDNGRRINAHAAFPALGVDNVAGQLQDTIEFPIFVENDAACSALGERLMGVGQTIDDFFLAHIGHGIGGGLVLDGRLYRGKHGNAGIIGVQFPNDAPRPSGTDLLETLHRQDPSIEDFEDLVNLTPQDNPALRDWINRASRQLREGLSVTARILDPTAIIVGGRLPYQIMQELVARIDGPGFCDEGVMLPRPRLFASSLGNTAGVAGAAAVPLYKTYFDTPSIERQDSA
nr:ROK family protein [Qipengyuania qiaonensis]